MILSFLKTIIYVPMYNGLILLMDALPFIDVGIAVILFTIIIKLLLFPLSKKAVKTQIEMKRIAPELEELKTAYKDDQQEYAKQMLALYKKHDINPFSSILLMLIQIPIIISLYYVFLKGLPVVDVNILYSFVREPFFIDTNFLGLHDISTSKGVWLALAAAVSSFFQMRFSVPIPEKKTKARESFKDDLARSMSIQMRYIFPIVIFFIAYNVIGVVALYWITSNIFTIGQEIYIRRHLSK